LVSSGACGAACVIAADGGLTGYRWGKERQHELLQREAAETESHPEAFTDYGIYENQATTGVGQLIQRLRMADRNRLRRGPDGDRGRQS
jgi:hypothetical protein